MHITLTPQQEAIIESAVHSGLFASADEAIDGALRVIEERERKLQALRAIVQESLNEGGAVTPEEMHNYLAELSAEAKAQGY